MSETQSQFSFPQVMGILNVTPDSFFDGGKFENPQQALNHARQMIAEGASIIDIGGESTRPGASPISVQEELDRVIPVIEVLRREITINKSPVTISIDTYKLEVMREAIKAGANFINDVKALREPGALEFAAQANVPVCLMHMQGSSFTTMQQAPQYENVVLELQSFFRERIEAALAAGIKATNLIIDPGFGFGKNLQHNLSLLRSLASLRTSLNLPMLIGISNKATIGELLDVPRSERLHGSLALAAWALSQGVSIIRVHEVKPTVEVMTIIKAVMEREPLHV